MASSRADRFVGNGENDIEFGRGTPNILGRYPYNSKILEKSEHHVFNCLRSDFTKNQILKGAWGESETWFNRLSDTRKNAIRMVYGSDNQILAATAYTVETPKLYGDFNKQTRDNNCFDVYDYDNYYYFLWNAFATAAFGESTTLPSMLYRGNSVRFSTKKGMVGCFRSFTSTSSRRDVPLGFLGDPKSSTLFQIKNATIALPLNDVSVFAGEEEFLLAPFSMYRVDEMKIEKDGLLVITLTDIQTTATPNTAYAPFDFSSIFTR